jgi:isocitrate lyase
MAVQQVKAGLKAIYLSGWQVAGDANLRPHLSGPVAVPGQLRAAVVKRINNALLRADEIRSEGEGDTSTSGWCRSWPTAKPASAAC